MSVSVKAGYRASFAAQVACMNIYKDIPDRNDTFGVDVLAADDTLLELLNIFKLYESRFEVIQAAIWILQDNPTKHYIMEALEFDDGEQAITDEEYEEALRLVERVRG